MNLDTIGYLDAELPAAGSPTLYSLAGDWLFLGLLILGLLPCLRRAR
jgi:apolipoprotein N-acyltransferase